MRKNVLNVVQSPAGHWVGDGFPVRSLFSYDRLGQQASPFLLLDYAGPMQFGPTSRPRGVGEHPHRGFETVTLVFSGEVAHRDSAGHGGVIGPGDVQWMTAASGILHEEFHSPDFTRQGGMLEMAQLWVNLPAAQKMQAPRYQALTNAQIPSVTLPKAAGRVRVIAGEHAGQRGPAATVTAINVWDVRLKAGTDARLALPLGHNTLLAVLRGAVTVNEGLHARHTDLVVCDRAGDEVHLAAHEDAVVLLLSGQPLDEPIVGHGPFVMNSAAEIETAISDFRSGRFGRLSRAGDVTAELVT